MAAAAEAPKGRAESSPLRADRSPEFGVRSFNSANAISGPHLSPPPSYRRSARHAHPAARKAAPASGAENEVKCRRVVSYAVLLD